MAKTELASTEPLFLGETHRSAPEKLWSHFHQPTIHNFVLYVFLLKDPLFNIYRCFINAEFTAKSTITHA